MVGALVAATLIVYPVVVRFSSVKRKMWKVRARPVEESASSNIIAVAEVKGPP